MDALKGGVSVVIPARNEAAGLAAVIAGLRAALPELVEILVVDDGSDDGSGAVAAQAGARVLRHGRPRGYGASLKTGILAARGAYVLTLDGDGQHRIEDACRVLAQAAAHDLVTGHRTRLRHSSLWRLPGKWALKALCGYLVRQPIPDVNCGLRVYRRERLMPYLALCSDGYSFTATSLVLLLAWGGEVAYVPIDVRPAPSQGRVTVQTGVDTFLLILRLATLVDPLRVFLPLSGATGVAGIAWAVPYALAGRGISVGALLLLMTALLLFAVGLLSDQLAQLRREHSFRG